MLVSVALVGLIVWFVFGQFANFSNVTLRVSGVPAADVSWAATLAVFAFARFVTAIPLTPGGVGVVELALIGGLTQTGGADANVVAAVLLFRPLTYVLPIVVGAFIYLYWRRNRSWRYSAPPLNGPAVTVTKPEPSPAAIANAPSDYR